MCVCITWDLTITRLLQSADDNKDVVLLADLINPHGHYDVNCVKWCPIEEYGNLLASAGDDGDIRIWRFPSILKS